MQIEPTKETRPVPPAFTDDVTGRRIQPLAPTFSQTTYFRFGCELPDGRVLLHLSDDVETRANPRMALVDPADPQPIILPPAVMGHYLHLRQPAGVLYTRRGRQLLRNDLMSLTQEQIGEIPDADELPGQVVSITADDTHLILTEKNQAPIEPLNPSDPDPAELWRWIKRERTGGIWTLRLADNHLTRIYDAPDYHCDHVEAHPTDPTLIRFCSDRSELLGQRCYTIRTDGSALTPIRLQERGEVVTHEFWWADPSYIGYTFQDRRQDETGYQIPWAEYAPVPTQLGIADTYTGEEIYCSDPLNSYHTHIYCSQSGKYVTGDGTDGNFGIFAAPFDMAETRIDLQLMASTHTPYIAFRGQYINLHTTVDDRYLIYGDTIGGQRLVMAVEMSF